MKVIVFLPGIMGSRLLAPDGSEVWPPTWHEALISGYDRIAELVRPDLRVGPVIDAVCVDFYGPILAHLTQTAAAIGGVFVPHPYDWRRDLVELGSDLGKHVDALVSQHGGETEIVLVCHSMGGLLARGWLERPVAAKSPGLKAVRLAVFLAVPHEGAPLAFARAIGVGGGSVGMSEADQRALSATPGFPAAYQLFPSRHLQPIWRLDASVPFDGLSLFDPSLVDSQGLRASHLAAAKTFANLLDPGRKPPGCRYFVVASGAHETMTRFDMQAGRISPVTVAGAGDGTVPLRSAAALPVQTAYVDAEHLAVAQHANTFALLAMLLGAEEPGSVAASLAADEPAVSISPKFATVGEDYEILVFPGRAAPLDGRLEIGSVSAAGAFEADATIAVAAASPGVRTIVIRGEALPPARYEVRLLKANAVLAKTEFVMMRRPE